MAIVLGLNTVLLASWCLLTWPLFPTGWMVQHAAVFWSWLTLRLSGAKLVVEGLERIDRRGVYVFAGNHLSTFDILAILMLQPTARTRFIAKKSLFYVPFFGWAMWIAGYIAIDRGNRKRAMESTQRALRKIQEGTSIVVYAEGTRSSDGKLLPFKTGGFLMAIRAKVPVVPVTIVGSHLLQPKGKFLVVPGTFKLIFDDPIPTAHLLERDRGVLAAQVRAIVARRLHQEGQISREELEAALAEPAPAGSVEAGTAAARAPLPHE